MRKDIIYLVAGIVCILVSVCISIIYGSILLSHEVVGVEMLFWFVLLNSSQLALFTSGCRMAKFGVKYVRGYMAIRKYAEKVKEYEENRKMALDREPFAEFL